MQMAEDLHRESLEEEATHATDEARMLLPGVQAVMGFQLMAVFNQRFELLGAAEQRVHLAAFLLLVLAMALIMAPAAYHRQVERGVLSRRFVDLASRLLTWALLPLAAGVALDTYLLGILILDRPSAAMAVAGAVAVVLAGLWLALPRLWRRPASQPAASNCLKPPYEEERRKSHGEV